ncbi:hypothetical protein N9850_14135 [Granulosicoccus sp.]|nr:hypothetical protein [Granulosicoccus sp.]MDB4224901.1 hypothetical protein [Granulosicoccus sp.]
MNTADVIRSAQPMKRTGSLIVCLNSLLPIWIAFARTLTETVGAGTLALPTAIATVGRWLQGGLMQPSQ